MAAGVEGAFAGLFARVAHMTPQDTTRVRPCANITWLDVDADLVLFDARDARCHGLDATASRLRKMLAEEPSVDVAAALIVPAAQLAAAGRARDARCARTGRPSRASARVSG